MDCLGFDWPRFIECKTRRLREDAKFIADDVKLEASLDAMAKFIVQHYSNIMDALDSKISWQPDGLPIFPLIVTLEDWWIFTQSIVQVLENRVVSRLELAGIDHSVLDLMPYTLASADEFEKATLISSQTGLAAFFVRKQSEKYRKWPLGPFMQQEFLKEMGETYRELFPDELKQLGLKKLS